MKIKKKVILYLIISILLVGFIILSVGIYSGISKKKCASSKEVALTKIKNKYGKELKYEFVEFENNIYKYQVQTDVQRNYYTLDVKTCKLDDYYILNSFLYENYK